MNLFELFVKIGVDDQASGKLGKLTQKLGNGLKTAAKIGTAAVTAAAAGIAALTTTAVKNYAEYEQLIGGAELMFGKAFDSVKKNAQEAYKTVQMSQNAYLKQVNGFATGLKTALGGNEKSAADLAHKIVQAEADIVAATGNTAENVQNAFNGIMRSNFTMLDNLQIGITPTKEGFQEVIDKVNEWNATMGKSTKYQMGNLADMQSALVDYIEMVGMSGYAQMEASKTISGSLASMKAAWTNLITGIADDNANFDKLLDNMVESVVTFGENILPKIETALDGVVKLVEKLFPKIVKKIPGLLEGILPDLVNSALTIVEEIISSIAQNKDALAKSLTNAISEIIMHAAQNTPELIGSVIDLILALITELGHNLDEIIPELIVSIINVITEIATRAPELTDAIFAVIDGIVNALTSPEGIEKMTVAGFQLLVGLISGIIGSVPKLIGNILMIIPNIVDSFLDADWDGVGKDIVDGVLGGLKKAWKNLKKWFTDAWNDLVGGVKDLLGIKSPSRVFAGIGKNMALGVGEGWDDTFDDIEDEIDNSLDFGEADYGITTSATSIGDFGGGSSAYGYGSAQDVNVTVSIDDSANAMGLARALLPFLKVAEKEVYA